MIRITLLTFLFALPLHGQSVVTHPESIESLAAKWEWAMDKGGGDSYWIGYRISKLMHPRSYYGMFNTSHTETSKSLYALIGEPEKGDGSLEEFNLGRHFNGRGTIHFEGRGDGGAQELVLKEIAVLVNYHRGNPVDVFASNMSLEFDLQGIPLYWLDHENPLDGVAMLRTVYDATRHTDTKEDLVTVLGLHGQYAEVEQFAREILTSKLPSDVRERAAFVMGQQHTETALATLKKVIRTDQSEDVKEHAVYAISQMSIEAAQELLIDLARNEKNEEVRKKAIYGLGQKASRKALDVLEETIYDEAEEEVQKHAVYALAQFDAEDALPRLIEIANTHQSREVRKGAIYMLGDIGTDEAVEALIEIVERY
ncbi:MAG: HEAT repeat domain-containing protein [Rhodothermaceae bacterium]|nr:HEAT repeat domain-containing protein [Rhodothermaceae bacterium]